jgi:hypothetical protein
VAEEAGAAATPVVDAGTNVDVVIGSIPEKRMCSLPEHVLAGASEDVIVVDTGNDAPSRDGRIAEIEGGLNESEWVARVLGRPPIACALPARRFPASRAAKKAADPLGGVSTKAVFGTPCSWRDSAGVALPYPRLRRTDDCCQMSHDCDGGDCPGILSAVRGIRERHEMLYPDHAHEVPPGITIPAPWCPRAIPLCVSLTRDRYLPIR